MSTTTNLKLFKHDNPTTNTDQFDVEKALNQNWDKLDTNAGEISSDIQILKTENTLLKSQIPSATVIGETIHLKDSSNMPCQITPLGASKQNTREGYNLINKEINVTNDLSNCTQIASDDTSQTFQITDNTKESLVFYKNISLNAGKTYTIKRLYSMISGNVDNSEGTVSLYDKNYSFVATILPKNSNKKTFSVATDGAYHVRIKITSPIVEYSDIQTVKISEVMLYEGTEDKPYEQYGALPSTENESPIESVGDNINILQNVGKTQSKNGLEFTVNKDGTVLVNGIATANTSFNLENTFVNYSAGEYFLNGCPPNGAADTYRIISWKEGYVVNSVDIGYGTKVTFDDTTKYITQIVIASGVMIDNLVFKPKIAKTQRETQYSPYGQGSVGISIGDGTTSETKAIYIQQPFRDVGDVKDRFVKKDGVWYEGHKIKRIIFDGTENWLYQARDNGVYRFNLLLDDAVSLSGRNQVLSNCFLYKGSSEEDGNCFISDKYIYLYSTISNISDFKAMLSNLYNAGTPVYVDYVLEEPELIPCTPEQVEQLESFNTYKNVTSLSSDSIGELEVFYYKDLETLLNK